MTDPKLTDEAGCLLALHRYCVLDSVHEPKFDTITSIVRDLLGVPICAVSLIDEDKQKKAIEGLGIAETPREVAFCDYTIRERGPLVVPDATKDPRFANHPLVTGDPMIRPMPVPRLPPRTATMWEPCAPFIAAATISRPVTCNCSSASPRSLSTRWS